MKIVVKEILKNDLVEHLNKMLYKTFLGTPMSFELSYFIGENDKGKTFLCMIINSGKVGDIYKRIIEIPSGTFISDLEAEFIDDVLNEVFVAGIGLFNIEFIRNQGKNGKESVLTTVINLN